ncbi:MAG: glucosamine-6-phosphate deaminase [Verrucomicrobiae bacterium]|nr:glucosamine-6-phosphate deaminase [Verrucomicrobiae bacterium]
MEIVILKGVAQACQVAARLVESLVREKPDAVLGLATGSTPVRLYAEMIRAHCEAGLDFGRVRTFNLDEYAGLPRDHEQSYYRFMREKLFDHVNINPANTNIPNGLAQDIPAHCRAYEDAIRQAGGVDLQILGIGANGHIGFNEPTSSLVSRTRIKSLTRHTIEENARFFGGEDEVPRHVITMGVGTIMESRQIVMLAFGEKKARAVADMIEGPLTSYVPASILQMHPNTKVFLDEEAAMELKRSEYYKWVYENKPAWQKF